MVVILARKGRARAHPVGEKARAKEWQSSKKTSEILLRCLIGKRQQYALGAQIFSEKLKRQVLCLSFLFCLVEKEFELRLGGNNHSPKILNFARGVVIAHFPLPGHIGNLPIVAKIYQALMLPLSSSPG